MKWCAHTTTERAGAGHQVALPGMISRLYRAPCRGATAHHWTHQIQEHVAQCQARPQEAASTAAAAAAVSRHFRSGKRMLKCCC